MWTFWFRVVAGAVVLYRVGSWASGLPVSQFGGWVTFAICAFLIGSVFVEILPLIKDKRDRERRGG